MSAALLVQSRDAHGVDLVGPPRPAPTWQEAVDGFGAEDFQIDWERQQATCPAGKTSMSWGMRRRRPTTGSRRAAT